MKKRIVNSIYLPVLLAFLTLSGCGSGDPEENPADLALQVDFREMDPLLDRLLELRVVNVFTGQETARSAADPITVSDFTLLVPDAFVAGETYDIDFYGDLNGNRTYDPPPTDQAWRVRVNFVTSPVNLEFTHNENFTDIEWPHGPVGPFDFEALFHDMTPYTGLTLRLRIVDTETGEEAERLLVDPVTVSDFGLDAPRSLDLGESYHIDFFVDYNANGSYDPPPSDHAWRFTAENVTQHVLLDFTRNSDYTDIEWP